MSDECKWIGIAPNAKATEDLKVKPIRVLKFSIAYFGDLTSEELTDLEMAGWKLQEQGRK